MMQKGPQFVGPVKRNHSEKNLPQGSKFLNNSLLFQTCLIIIFLPDINITGMLLFAGPEPVLT